MAMKIWISTFLKKFEKCDLLSAIDIRVVMFKGDLRTDWIDLWKITCIQDAELGYTYMKEDALTIR